MTEANATALVTARGAGMRYGPTQVLHDVDLDVREGAQVSVTGRSGSGKTTLLLLLAGLVEPSEGTVAWPALHGHRSARRAQIGMVFQAPSLMPELTALENVVLPLRLRGAGREGAGKLALTALGNVAAADLAQALPSQLSGGQQQRVAIARALAGEHRLVLADEPTGALDRAHARAAVLALRDGVAATGGALVLATHDPELAELFDEQLAVVDGRIHESLRSR